MGSTVIVFLLIIAGVIAIPAAIMAIVYLVVPAFKGVFWLIAHIFKFVIGEIGDLLRIIGSAITAIVFIPLTVLNVLIGRWSASAHYGRAIQAEGLAIGRSAYRMVIGHPARLLLLGQLTEGLEKRIPEVVAAAPGADRPGKRQGQFDGYAIVGSLAGGGSGGKLYIAEPSAEKIASFARQGQMQVGRVVIKSFSLADGSTLPQIVRENRALPAAKRMGLILEHELTEERFFYVTRYVPGESLGIATQRLHSAAGGGSLAAAQLRTACGYASDLLRTLTNYHEGGLWHKDVKPDNIIVAANQAHLVDFGLVTPLRSSMTLTTHGTEYFRDPEMVRMALRGVKVHEVDGAKFDLYGAGAVLYSMIENSFPAHGGLSQITRPCPEAIRWIVRRAMTDYDKRYDSAALMLDDLNTVLAAADLFEVKPFELPSMRGSDAAHHGAPGMHGWEGMAGPAGMGAAAVAAAAMGAGPAVAGAGAAPGFGRKPGPMAAMLGQVGEYVDSAFNAAGCSANPAVAKASATAAEEMRKAAGAMAGGKPRIRVTDWWSGKYEILGDKARGGAAVPVVPAAPFTAPRNASSAAEQLVRARARAKEAQGRAHRRMATMQSKPNVGLNLGVGLAVLVFLAACGMFAAGITFFGLQQNQIAQIESAEVAGTETLEGSNVRLAVSTASLDAPIPTASADHALDVAMGVAGAQIVVLRDVVSLQVSSGPAVDLAVGRLAALGLDVVGDRTAPADAGDDETIAELRNAVGVAPFQTAESESALRAWLREHPEVAAVVWVGRHAGGEPIAWLVAADAADTETVASFKTALTGRESRRSEPERPRRNRR